MSGELNLRGAVRSAPNCTPSWGALGGAQEVLGGAHPAAPHSRVLGGTQGVLGGMYPTAPHYHGSCTGGAGKRAPLHSRNCQGDRVCGVQRGVRRCTGHLRGAGRCAPPSTRPQPCSSVTDFLLPSEPTHPRN